MARKRKQAPQHEIAAAGVRQSELSRAIRALKAAGVAIGHIEITEGKVVVHPAANGVLQDSSGYLSISEACIYGKFGRSRAYQLIADGSLQFKKFGKKTLIKKASIDRMLAKLPAVRKKSRRYNHTQPRSAR
jgi:excisionase family DNA binding protein